MNSVVKKSIALVVLCGTLASTGAAFPAPNNFWNTVWAGRSNGYKCGIGALVGGFAVLCLIGMMPDDESCTKDSDQSKDLPTNGKYAKALKQSEAMPALKFKEAFLVGEKSRFKKDRQAVYDQLQQLLDGNPVVENLESQVASLDFSIISDRTPQEIAKLEQLKQRYVTEFNTAAAKLKLKKFDPKNQLKHLLTHIYNLGVIQQTFVTTFHKEAVHSYGESVKPVMKSVQKDVKAFLDERWSNCVNEIVGYEKQELKFPDSMQEIIAKYEFPNVASLNHLLPQLGNCATMLLKKYENRPKNQVFEWIFGQGLAAGAMITLIEGAGLE